MPAMTDPMDALLSFQKALLDGELSLRRGELNTQISVFYDEPAGSRRFTYVMLQGKTVTALAVLVSAEAIDGIPAFQAGVAVPEQFRGRGYAKAIMKAAIAELRHGLARNNVSPIVVEAIVAETNHPSKRVAAAAISKDPKRVTDEFSGVPALQYVGKF